jgi:hypothetical protein
MMVNGKVILDRVMASKYGPTVPDIKESGLIIKHKEKVNLLMLMETSMMEIGKKIKHQDMESTFTIMEPGIKVNGSMIINMVKVSKPG